MLWGKKSPKQALKNSISRTVKKQTGGSLALRMKQKGMNRRRSKCSGSKTRKRSKNGSHFKRPAAERSWSDFFQKLETIFNILPREATHSSLPLFEKPALLVTFDGKFCRTAGSIYSPNGPCLSWRLLVTEKTVVICENFPRNQMKYSFCSWSWLKYDVEAAADVTKTDDPDFCINFLHSLFSDCSVSANGLKISNATGNHAHKSFIKFEIFYYKEARADCLVCQGYFYKENPGAIAAAEVKRRKALVRQSAEYTFYGKIAKDFFQVRSTSLD